MSGGEVPEGPLDERLADWVDGRMNPDERAAFEAWLAEDAARMGEAEAYRSAVAAVRGVLRQGPHAPRDFADRVVDAACAGAAETRAAPGARRFAWMASAAAAALLTITFVLVQRLNRAVPHAEATVADGSRDRADGVEEAREALGADAFFAMSPAQRDAAADPIRREPADGALGVTAVEEFLTPPQPSPVGIGGGAGGGMRMAIPGGGGGAGPGAGRPAGIRSPAGPASPGPGGVAVAGTNSVPGGPSSAERPGEAPIGALVYVVTWPTRAAPPSESEEREAVVSAAPLPRRSEAAGPDLAALQPVPSAVLSWFEARLARGPLDNVIALPADLVPVDLGPARLALAPVTEGEAVPMAGEYRPGDGDLAFRLQGDAAQTERLLRTLLTAARSQGATLGLERSRFRRLDLRTEKVGAEDDASDVVLVMRWARPAEPLAEPEPADQPASKKRG